MAITLIGERFLFGIHTPKPLSNPPANSRIHYRMRAGQFAFAIVYDLRTRRAQWAAIRDDGDTWTLDYDVQGPRTTEATPAQNIAPRLTL